MRAIDVVFCGAVLIILSPVMLYCATRIKRGSPGPVIYAQRRVCKDGRVFKIYKFTRMYIDAEARGAQRAQGDG